MGKGGGAARGSASLLLRAGLPPDSRQADPLPGVFCYVLLRGAATVSPTKGFGAQGSERRPVAHGGHKLPTTRQILPEPGNICRVKNVMNKN